MTDPNVPSQTPATPPATPYTAPAGTAPKQGLSLTSFILGLAGIVFSWALIFGLLVSVAAVILGFIAKGKEPNAPKWMWIVGLITGGIGVLISLLILVFWIIAFATFASVGGLTQIPGY